MSEATVWIGVRFKAPRKIINLFLCESKDPGHLWLCKDQIIIREIKTSILLSSTVLCGGAEWNMRHCTCDNTQSDVVIICLCDGKKISVSYVRDESNPAPGSSKQRHIILPRKNCQRPGPGHPWPQSISEYDPQQIKHQKVEGNISVDGQFVSVCSHYTLFISCKISSTGIHPCFFGLSIYSNPLYTFSRGLESLIRGSYWLPGFVVFCPRPKKMRYPLY